MRSKFTHVVIWTGHKSVIACMPAAHLIDEDGVVAVVVLVSDECNRLFGDLQF